MIRTSLVLALGLTALGCKENTASTADAAPPKGHEWQVLASELPSALLSIDFG